MRRMEEAFEAVSADEPDADVADLAARLGRSLALAGEVERAAEANELALGPAQALRLPETLVRALGTKEYLSRVAGRPKRSSRCPGMRFGTRSRTIRGTGCERVREPVGQLLRKRPVRQALEALGEAVALARRTGERAAELFALSETTYALTMTGRWDEAIATFDELPEEQLRANSNFVSVLSASSRSSYIVARSGGRVSSYRGSTSSRVKTGRRTPSTEGRRQRSSTPRAGSAKPSTPARTPPESRTYPRP